MMLRRLTGIFSVLSWSGWNFACFLVCMTIGLAIGATGNWGNAAYALVGAALNLLFSVGAGIIKAIRVGGSVQ